VNVYVYFRFGGSGGKEGGEREKWIIIGLVGTVALLGTLAYYEMGYKEIAWKEFVNK
jgi:AFG3 family protein